LCFTTIASAEPPDLAGKWSGYWVSEKNGHMGPLQGTFTRLDEDTYRVRYRGRFAKIVPFFYSTKMHVAGTSEDAVFLTASQNLGPFLGTFRTNATATATSFDAGFSSRGDSGRFVLTRKK
jgi:hypothetical protein